jgi:hypothetical protein
MNTKSTPPHSYHHAKRLLPAVERALADMKRHQLTPGTAVIEILRSLVMETRDSTVWEHSKPQVKACVAQLYGIHRENLQ